MTQTASTSVTLEKTPSAPTTPKSKPKQRFSQTPLGSTLKRVFKISSSLQLAIILLSTFALTLILATFLESWYSAQIGKDLIYHTWWFAGLLGLLAVNILCAALKKFPWKRHQIGFLITHAGLLVLIAGGLASTLFGEEGRMVMIDSEHRGIQNFFHISNQTDTMQLAGQQQLEIVRIPEPDQGGADPKLLQALEGFVQHGWELDDEVRKKLKGGYWHFSFWPGSFQWKSDQHLTKEIPWGLKVLQTMADPNPQFTRKLTPTVAVRLNNFYPYSEGWRYRPAKKGEAGFPALQLSLVSPMTGDSVTKRWITPEPKFQKEGLPIHLEMWQLLDSELLGEFLNPPAAKELGNNGKLVLVVGPERQRVEIDLNTVQKNRTKKLPGTKILFTLRKSGHVMDMLGHGNHQLPGVKKDPSLSFFPAVKFDLEGPDWTGTWITCARMPSFPSYQAGKDAPLVTSWYHYPDFRWGEKGKMGSLEFVQTRDAKVYYRVYGKNGLKGPGKELLTQDHAKVHQIPWGPMSMKMQVLHYLPKAIKGTLVQPLNLDPGADVPNSIKPALSCVLANGKARESFLVRMSRKPVQVNVGRNVFFVRYTQAGKRMKFTLKLNQAQRVTDPGSSRPASFQSDVTLGYFKNGRKIEKDHQIYMNHTLDHGGYKVYQTDFEPIIHPGTGKIVVDPETNRMVSMSGLTVASDPGLWMKYAGSCLLVLGIATMFYMKAYFFKPRKRTATESA